MRRFYFVYLLILFTACLEKDNYLNVPAETDGLRLLTIDTGRSLLQTIQKINVNIIDTNDLCMVVESKSIHEYKVFFIEYKGIQLVSNNQSFFYSIPGALSFKFIQNDSNTRIVNSHIGKVVLDITNPENIIPLSFEFIPPADIPRIKPCLYEKVLVPASTFSKKYYFECPNQTNNIIYGWEIGKLNKPKCYAYD